MEIRKLHATDIDVVKNMDTGIENDYVIRVFTRLTTGNNHLFGLFIEDKLAVIGGFTIFKERNAMLGRLRSDVHFRGQNLATTLNYYLIDKAFQMKGIEWVSANTEEDNPRAMKILKKIGLKEQIELHGAQTKDIQPLLQNDETWEEVKILKEKKQLIQMHLINQAQFFPYECYYPFPATEELFTEDEVAEWKFFRNKDASRFFILKKDQKKHMYAHVVYPWNDLHKQRGLWETVQENYQHVQTENEEDIYIWIDLTKEEIKQLPDSHPFRIPSAWILFGITKEAYEKLQLP